MTIGIGADAMSQWMCDGRRRWAQTSVAVSPRIENPAVDNQRRSNWFGFAKRLYQQH